MGASSLKAMSIWAMYWNPLMSKKVRSSDVHSWNGGDEPSNGVGVGKRGCDTASMLMSDGMMFASSRVISPDEVDSVSLMSDMSLLRLM